MQSSELASQTNKNLDSTSQSFTGLAILTLDIIKHRNRKNVISLSGQTFSFFIETLGGIMMQLFYAEWSFIEPATFPICLLFMSTCVSIVHIITSPELRRFYF